MLAMNADRRRLYSTLLLASLLAPLCFSRSTVQAQTSNSTSQSAKAPGVLNRTEAAAILPEKVFYAGQSAPIQARNSAGIRFAQGKLLLAALVDTSGYSTGVQEKYQGYLLTEVPIHIGSGTLKAGAYGFGFVADNRVLITDIGSNEVLHTAYTADPSLPRPNPLQIQADQAHPGQYRLYLGRNFVTLSAQD